MDSFATFATLAALLLPGTLFCALMTGEIWRGVRPKFIVLGKPLPLPAIYLIVLSGGWLFLILWLHEIITRNNR